MKDFLAAATTTAKDAKGSRPRILVRIDLKQTDGSTVTHYLAEEALTFNSQAYRGIIKSIGDFVLTSERGMDSVVLEVNNLSSPRFSGVLLAATAVPEKSAVRIYQHFSSITPDAEANLVLLFDGAIDVEGIRYSEANLTIPLVDRTLKLPDRVGTVITKTNLPNAAEEAYGKILPIVYGNCVRVPAVPAVVQAGTKLYGSLPASDSSAIEVEDTSEFASSGTLKIDEEKVAYIGKTATTFTGITRGASSTVAADHAHGADVTLFGTETYVVAGHAVKAIASVKVGPHRQTPVNIQAGSPNIADAASFPGIGTVATIKFDGKPLYRWVENTAKRLDVSFNTNVGSTATSPLSACRDDAGFQESNYATLAGGQFLQVRQTDAVPPPGEILKCWAVVKWFGQREITGPLSVTFKPGGGAFGSSLGNLHTPQAADVQPDIVIDGVAAADVDHTHGGGAAATNTEFMNSDDVGWINAANAHDQNLNTFCTSNTDQQTFKVTHPTAFSDGTLVRFRVRAKIAHSGSGQMDYKLSAGGTSTNGSAIGTFAAQTVDGPWRTTTNWGEVNNESQTFGQFKCVGTGTSTVYECWIEYENTSTIDPLSGTSARSSSNWFDQYFDITTAVAGDWTKLDECEVKVNHGGGGGDYKAYVYEVRVVVEYFPYTLLETELVSADVEGQKDDGSGTYSGSANILLENPHDVFHHFVRVWGSVALANLDKSPGSPYATPSMDDARTQLAALGYKWAGVLYGDPPSFDEVLKQMALESRCLIFWEGGSAASGGLLRMRFQPTAAPSAVKTLTVNEVRNVPALERMSLHGDFANLLTLLYDRDRTEDDKYLVQLTGTDATSVTRFGSYPRTYRAQFVRDTTTATDLLNNWFLSRFATPKRWLELSGFLDQIELERGDTVAVTYALLDLSAVKFLIETVRRVYGEGGAMDTINFRAREW